MPEVSDRERPSGERSCHRKRERYNRGWLFRRGQRICVAVRSRRCFSFGARCV